MATSTTATTAVVNGFTLSHGTLESRVLKDSKRFYKEFLGLTCIRHHEGAQVITFGNYPWIIACVHAGDNVHTQGPENQWGIQLAAGENIDRAHAAATALKETYGIRHIDPVEERGAGRCFRIQDLDGNWWEIESRQEGYYDTIFGAGGSA